MMSRTITRRALALLFAALAALMIAPAAAFAADAPDADVAFQVVTENADGTVETVSFSQAQLADLAKSNTTPVAYLIKGKKGTTVNVATEYATIDQLLQAAGMTFEPGDKLTATENATENPFSSSISYEAYAAAPRYFYPAYTPEMSAGSMDATGAEEAPGIVAIKWGSATLESGTAGALVSDAASAAEYGSLRNFWGKTQAEYAEANLGGNNLVNNLFTITISKPFNIYTRTGAGDKTIQKLYYRSDFVKLAEVAAEGQGYLFNKAGWQVGVTTSYIPLSMLLADAFGPTFALAENQSIVASAADGFSTTLSYDQYTNGKYFYPATTSSDVVADGAEEVGTVLALNWRTTDASMPLATTAGAAKRAIAESGDLTSQYRIFTGLRAPDDSNTGGNRFATGPVEISVTTMKDISDASVTVSGIEKSYQYTGEAITPEVTVKDGEAVLQPLSPKKVGDYEVTYENNIDEGTATVTITGKNSYTGVRTETFQIEKPAPEKKDNAITTATNKVAKSYKANKAGKLAKAKTIKLESVLSPKATFGKVTYSVKKADSKKVLSLNGSKVKVKKGAKVGKYTMEVNLSVAESDQYKAANKVVKVVVNVKKK